MVSFSNTSGGQGKFNRKSRSWKYIGIGCSINVWFYLLIMKFKCGTGDKTTNERRLFGYVGLITFVIGVPVLYVVDLLEIEKFQFLHQIILF